MPRRTRKPQRKNFRKPAGLGANSILLKIIFVLAVGLLSLIVACRIDPELPQRLQNLPELPVLSEVFEQFSPELGADSAPFSLVPDGEIWVHFIDVGQGDSILVHSREHAVLIDAGTQSAGRAVAAHLRAMEISRLDFVIATHPHADHIGGLPLILDSFDVGELWMPDVVHTTDTFENLLDAIERSNQRNNLRITTAAAGATGASARLQAGIINMVAVAPNRTGYSSLNNYSIALRKEHGATAFLFTGDIEALAENEIVAAHYITADVLDVPHHGSSTSSTARFLDAVAPGIAVISSGAGNQFGHPQVEVLERLHARGVQVLRTDELGTVSLGTDGASIFRLEF